MSVAINKLQADVSEQHIPISPSQTRPLDGNDPFWGDDPSILVETSRLREFFPTADQTLAERMNSITRLIIYISVILAVYQGRATALHFGILVVVVIYFMWKQQTVSKEGFSEVPLELTLDDDTMQEQCVMPTLENPFMNFLPGDDPARAAACRGPGVQEMAANMLDRQLFDDVDNLFSNNASQRMFMTMPNTTGVPDRERFSNLLFKNAPNCKIDGNCAPYEDLRLQRQLIPEDLENDLTVSGFNL